MKELTNNEIQNIYGGNPVVAGLIIAVADLYIHIIEHCYEVGKD